MGTARNERLQAVRGQLVTLEVDAAVVTARSDVRWICGFSGSNGWLLVDADKAFFYTDGRYAEQAAQEVPGLPVRLASHDLVVPLAEDLEAMAATRIAFQSDNLTVARLETLRQTCAPRTWVPISRLLTQARAAKSIDELDRMRRAQAISEAAFLETISRIKPGQTEREIAADLIHAHLRGGADGMSFEPIVASGPNSALPHARPTDRETRRGEPLLIDAGCHVDGYASDMTRMVHFGEPPEDFRADYEIIRAAITAAERHARAGIPGSALDSAARTVIDQAGRGALFTHSLGHGVGLDVHEWPPVSYRTDDLLPEGAVITLEPGLYREGRYGIRIEDMVLLNDTSCQRITTLSRDLIII